MKITLDDDDRPDWPDRPWRAIVTIDEGTDDEDDIAAFGSTPQWALANLISEYGLDEHPALTGENRA